MNSTPSMMSRLAAVAGFAVAIWIATPAMAEIKTPAGLVGTRTASAPVKRHHDWPRYRVASWYASRVHTADASSVGRQCYWWCGRSFVLMVGIAY